MHKRNGPQAPPGRGAVTARQLGLLVDFSPDGLMIPEDGVNDEELEAEFLALVGGQPQALEKLKGKGPLPMEAIEKMARLCMRDLDEDEEGTDEDVEADEDLLAELNEVLGEERKAVEPVMPVVQPKPSSPNPGIEATLQERLILYQSAVESARQAGDSAKMRRYDRGLKTLENLLVSAKKGNTINEADIPPPVASGKGPATGHSHTHTTSHLAPVSPPAPEPSVTLEAPSTTAQTSAKPQLSPDSCSPLARLQSLQHEYKVAALRAKHQDDTATAARYLRVAKSFDPVLEALSRGELVDLSRLPPPPDQLSPEPPLPAAQPVTPASTLTRPEVPQPPKNLLEALEQRMERYHVAAAQAKAKGDQRKARMHERIVKQYQDAIRAHKAGRAVDVAELPVPPGFPPIQGLESAEPSQQSLVGVLETAMKLANHDEGSDEEEEETPKKNTPAASTAQPKTSPSRAAPSGPAPAGKAASKGTSTRAQQQLAFLEGRKKQLLQAALRAKQKNDVEGAKMHLRQAKGLEPMLEASRNGLPVDIAKVPPAPVNKDDFVLVQRPGPGMSQEAVRRYGELTKLLRQQHEMCLNHSTQFTHLGNIAETIKFEKLAEDCKRSMDTLKQAFARSLPTPAARFEQRTFSVIKIFPDLSNNDMLLFIVKGINLPTPPGLSPSDLDAFVRFDFPYPNVEEAQKDKTSVIKSTDSPGDYLRLTGCWGQPS